MRIAFVNLFGVVLASKLPVRRLCYRKLIGIRNQYPGANIELKPRMVIRRHCRLNVQMGRWVDGSEGLKRHMGFRRIWADRCTENKLFDSKELLK
jgi:hypothetical protein